MYLLYLDESENSNQNKKTVDSLSVFGLSGLLITSRYITNLIEEFWKIKKDNNIPDEWEIHAFEIFSGSGKWKNRFTDDQRRKICKDFSALVAKNNRLALAWFCYKESKLSRNDYMSSLEGILKKATGFIGKKKITGKQLLIIFDQKDEFKKTINKFILEQRNVINSGKNKKGICRIIDHGFSGNSSFSELLQLSDFIGYVSRLCKTLKRKDTLFSKKQDQRFIDFVDNLVSTMSKKVKEVKVK